MEACREQTSGLTRGGSTDAIAGDARVSRRLTEIAGYRNWLLDRVFHRVALFGVKRVYASPAIADGRAVVPVLQCSVEIELERLGRKMPMCRWSTTSRRQTILSEPGSEQG